MAVVEDKRTFRRVTLGNAEFLTPVPPLECPDCGGVMVLRRGSQTAWVKKHPVFYGCTAWPTCKGTHGAHPDGKPLGIPANAETKRARMAAHEVFDKLWKGPTSTLKRAEAYRWMRAVLGLTDEEGHIGRFDVAQCTRLIEAVRRNFGGRQ